jgi:hypothetical protein
MTVRASVLFCVVAILLCLDSVLKVNVSGLYLQAGLLIAVISFALMALSHRHFQWKEVFKDRGIVLIIILTLSHFYMATDLSVYFRMLFYLLMFFVVYAFVFLSIKNVNIGKLSFYCVLILCLSGMAQYILTNYGNGLHLRGMDAEYYLKNGDLAYRMRGFFLEPNWFGLILFSWFYVYYRSISNIYSSNFIILLLISIVCLLLSGNRLILIFSCAIVVIKYLQFRNFKVINKLPMIVLLASGVVFWILALWGDFDDRSAAARLYTAYQTISILETSSISELLFGYGFSNWGGYSNILELSWSNYTFDQELTRRDNSEMYVVLFEMGVVGVLIYLYDAYFLTTRKNSNILDRYFIVFIYIASFVYPMYTFMMYMMPYMIIRSSILRGNDDKSFN